MAQTMYAHVKKWIKNLKKRNKGENQKDPGINENESIDYQKLWGRAKAVLREKFIAMSAYIKIIEISQINNLMLHLKLLEKQDILNSKLVEEEK
jgi:hypothetical protein